MIIRKNIFRPPNFAAIKYFSGHTTSYGMPGPLARDVLSLQTIQNLPKADLHVHLDGSLRLDSLLDIAREEKSKLPALPSFPGLDPRDWTVDMLKADVFPSHYDSLESYLRGFAYTIGVLQTPSALERAAFEFAEDCARDNVKYVEVRFAPHLHVTRTMDTRAVLRHVAKGLSDAQRALKARRIEFHFGIIVCGLRLVLPSMGHYYSSLYAALADLDPKRLAGLASLSLVHTATLARDVDGLPIVALDLAGPEAGFPAGDHREAFDLARKRFFSVTVHAGEAYGAESISTALHKLHASRLGHGFHLFDPTKIVDSRVGDKPGFVAHLVRQLVDQRTTVEVCLTSNLQTLTELQGTAGLKKHALKLMLDARLSVALCTDNTLFSHTSLSRELRLACEHFDISLPLFRDIVLNSFSKGFFFGSYTEKQALVARMTDEFDRVVLEANEERRRVHMNAFLRGER